MAMPVEAHCCVFLAAAANVLPSSVKSIANSESSSRLLGESGFICSKISPGPLSAVQVLESRSEINGNETMLLDLRLGNFCRSDHMLDWIH